jgi:hypothetical protein
MAYSRRRAPELSTTQRTALAKGLVAVESVTFRGHPLVSSLHPTTIEVTTEGHLTARGDCIIGVSAAKGCGGLSEGMRLALRTESARVLLRISVGSDEFSLTARGDPRLELSHPHDIVIRRSRFLSDRTLAVGASAAAKDIPRSMVRQLRNPEAVGELEIQVG